MMASPPNLSQINSKWIWQGGHPALSITPVPTSDMTTQLTACLTPLTSATITPLLNVSPITSILPIQPVPQVFIQTVISSSTDVKPLTEVTLASNSQNNAVTSSNTSVTSSSATGKKVGSDPCVTPIVTMSMKELRNKGSSFLRTHASKHGIPNASRYGSRLVLKVSSIG